VSFEDDLEWTWLRRDPKRVVIASALVGILILSGLVVGPYAYFYLMESQVPSCHTGTTGVAGFGVGTGQCAQLGVSITYQQDTFPRLSMLSQGYHPSCWAFCHGITYTE
jgi:hypothetical protein